MYVGAIPGALVAGWLADRFGRRVVMLAVLLVLCVTSIAAAASPDINSLIVARMLSGLALGAYPPLLFGSTISNVGVPRMSPALLSKRPKDLELAGVVQRVASGGKAGGHEYRLTPAGRELEPIIKAMGFWGQRWVETAPTLQNLDPELLMWDMRRSVNVATLPRQRTVVQFTYTDRPEKKRSYWLVVEANGMVDVCSIDPGFEVDLYVTTDLRTMTTIWLGLTTIHAVTENDRLTVVGDTALERTMPTWLGLSSFAAERKLALA